LPIKTIKLSQLASELGIAARDIQEAQRGIVANAIIKEFPNIIKNSPVDTGLFSQSWDLVQTETSMLLGNYAPHASIIEYGARPFTPPIGPLLAWAKRVLQDPSQPPEYSSDVWGLAKGTQKKISELGMQPKGVMEKAIPKIIDQIKIDIEAMQ